MASEVIYHHDSGTEAEVIEAPHEKIGEIYGLGGGFRLRSKAGDVLRVSANIDVDIRRCTRDTRYSPIHIYEPWYLHDRIHNIKPNAGVSFFAAQCYAGNSGGSVGTNGTNFMALSNVAFTPTYGDTILSQELTVNGLSRAQGTVTIGASASGSLSLTISYTWTDSTATTSAVQAGAVFTASSAGTMGHEYTFTSTNLAVNDQIQTTLTITVS